MSDCHVRNGGFLGYPRQGSGRTQSALQETNGLQKPGRATAPKGTDSPFASAARDLDLPLQTGLSLPRDVLGRRSTPIYAVMDTTAHNSPIQHVTGCPGYPGSRAASTGNRNDSMSAGDARQTQCPTCPVFRFGQPGHRFPKYGGYTTRTDGVSRLSCLESILSYTRAHGCALTRLTHSINRFGRQDSRDTRGGATGYLESQRLSRQYRCPGWSNAQTGHLGQTSVPGGGRNA